MSLEIHARHYRTSEAVRVRIESGLIASLEPAPQGATGELPWVAPGLVDLQINGYGGQEFCSSAITPELVREVALRLPAFGVTRFCPTVTTAGAEQIEHSLRAIAAACERSSEVERLVLGIHLEGPYISSEDGPRGAHPLEHCREPNWDEFQRFQAAAGGRICLVTLSPEFDQSPGFISKAVGSGVTVSIGHTSASGDQIRVAVDAGASLSTHLGNGAHRMLRRHPNYLWDQLADDRLWAMLIVDGHHLPAEVVKTFVRAKTAGRCLLVSDLSGLAGQPPGIYETNLCRLEILDDGRLVIAGQDQLLAGARLPIGAGILNLTRFAELALADAIDMASLAPPRAVGRPAHPLQAGQPADLVLFAPPIDGTMPELSITATIAGGLLAFGTLPSR